MRSRSYASTVSVLITATACSGVLGINSDTQLVPCTADSDCSSNQVCQNHKCEPYSSISTSQDTGGTWSLGGTSNSTWPNTGGVGPATGGVSNVSSSTGGASALGGTSAAPTGGTSSVVPTGGTSSMVPTGGMTSTGGTSGPTSSAATGGASTSIGGTANGGAVTGGTATGVGGTTVAPQGGTAGYDTTGGTSTTAAGNGGCGGISTCGGDAGTGGSTGGTGSGVCTPGKHRCYAYDEQGQTIAWQTCDETGNWGSDVPCPGYCSEKENGCVVAPSCSGLTNCNTNRNCCNSVPIPAGTFNRSPFYDDYSNQICADPDLCPAQLSAFLLDTYEVTVSRFRNFVKGYPDNLPKNGSGNNANNSADTGWDETWYTTYLPSSQSDLVQALQSCANSTYTVTATTNEFFPINCVDWYLAFAFCAWDGGRLPTEAEWNYAASGGEGRVYPWSDPPSAISPLTVDYANYGNIVGSPENVGKASLGIGRWGQLDLAGNVYEWLVDTYGGTYPNPTDCLDCADLNRSDPHITMLRGGGYASDESLIMVAPRNSTIATDRYNWLGFRCARSL
jgi:formylglycine-generating enzyme